MEDFAKKLLAYVDDHYAPSADTLANRMLSGLPPTDSQFGELSAFVTVLASAQDTCQQNIYNFANGTHGFAKAAEQVSAQYRGSDAFAHARLSDVESALVTAGLLPPSATPPGSSSAASSGGVSDRLAEAFASDHSVPFDPSAGSSPPPPSPASPPPSSSPPQAAPSSPAAPLSSSPSSPSPSSPSPSPSAKGEA